MMQQQQRTEYVLAQRGQYGGLEVVDRESGAEVSADVQRVEVLRDVDWLHMENLVIPACRDVNVRSRLLLRSCPHLQHLDIDISPDKGYV